MPPVAPGAVAEMWGATPHRQQSMQGHPSPWYAALGEESAAGYPSWPASSEGDFSPAGAFDGAAPLTPSSAFPGASAAAAAGGPLSDAHAANQLAVAMKDQLQVLCTRVQKLERSRGQISKDINDMLFESREMRKHLGIDAGAAEVQKVHVAPLAPGLVEAIDAADPVAVGRKGSRTKTAPPPSLPTSASGVDSGSGSGAASPAAATVSRRVAKATTERILPPPGLSMPLPESLAVTRRVVDGADVSRVEWRIDNAKAKFKDCVGRPLVSPPFEVAGLEDCRLMVAPSLGLDVSGLSMREQKSKYEARIAEGPLNGVLKFKVVTSGGEELVVKFSLFVGSVSKGPLTHDFAEHIIQGAEFPSDWLDELQGAALVVGVEVLGVPSRGDGKAS